MVKGDAMTETKQTMRAHLRQHGLPEAWAEWVESWSIAVDRPEQEFTVLRPWPPERVVTSYDEDGFGSDFERTDSEMLVAWKEYAEAIAKWCTEHGSADHGKARVKVGAEVWEAKLCGGGASLLLRGASETGPWRAVEWTARPSGRGLSMIESIVAEWFDAEGWLKPVKPGAVYSRDGAAEKKPKLGADDITAALWDMPGKERTVVLYPFWPAISEAAQRTHHAEEKATAAIADAAHYRCLLNDCRRVLTTAEDDRDAARKERDEALRKLAEAAPLPIGTSGRVRGSDGWEYPAAAPFTERAEKLRELCLEMASYLTERAGRVE